MNKISPDRYQQAVISSDSRNVVVQAGAGSGKTFTLLTKIHNLVSYKNIDPSCILVLTFTRVAAMHMREKYLSYQDSKYDETPDFCTFHSFCYKVLSEYPDVLAKLGYEEIPSIASDLDMQRYRMQAKSMSGATKLSNRYISNPDMLRGKDKLLYERYKQALDYLISQANCIDYDTLCISICSLFEQNDDCVKPIKNRYKYVFVDEFQDTDPYQFDFVNSMENASVVLCGDALQNIYQFRGCSNEIMKSIVDSDSWDRFILPINYRSTMNICQYVNKMSSKFKSKKYAVDLVSANIGPNVRECKVKDTDSLYNNLQQYIKAVKDKGTVAVLFRTNREVQECSLALKNMGIPCSLRSDDTYMQDLIKCLEDESFRYAFYVANLCNSEYEDYYRLSKSGYSDKCIFDEYEFDSICDVKYKVDSILDVVNTQTPDNVLQCLENVFNVEHNDSVQFDAAEDVLAYMINRVASSCKKNHTVYVGTIHSVKGLEFDSVAVCEVNSKAFGINSEENENLLYTACTRAKTNLIVFKHCK